ncbi:MAG: MFS transporter [Planctomycetia bacterium]|nr:MFS transporter [Planctomycetia bacterium]
MAAADVSPPDEVPPEPPDRAHRSALLIVFLVVFIDLLGFGIVMPLLPRIAKHFLPGGEASPWAGPVIGSLMASFSAMQFIFAPIYGRISDRIGRRPILLLGLGTSVLFYILLGVGCMIGLQGDAQLGLILLFVARIGAGISGATIGTAQAVIADSTTPERRSRGMALIGAAFGIGFTFGPLIGYLGLALTDGNLAGPGFMAAGLSLLAFLLGVAILPETLRPGSEATHRRWLDWQGLRIVLDTPTLGLLILMYFMATFSFAMFEPTLVLLLDTPGLKLDEQRSFLVFTYVGLVLALAQGLLYRRLAAKWGETRFMLCGALLMVVGLAGIGWLTGMSEQADAASFSSLLLALLGVLAVAVTGFAFMTPSVQALISRRGDPTRQGEILGVNQSANAMARILGPPVGTSLYYATSTHMLPYLLGACLLLLVFGFTFRIREA